MAERLFNTYQIAGLLGATPGAVVEWMDKGWLDYRRMDDGESVRISEGSLIEFLRDRGVDLGEILDEAIPADQRDEIYREAHARQVAAADQSVQTTEAPPQEPTGPPDIDKGIVKAFPDSASADEPPAEISDDPAAETQLRDVRSGQVCDAILADALDCGAEAVHLTPHSDRLKLQLRIKGVLDDKPHFAGRLPDGLRTDVIACLLALADPDIDPASMTVPHSGEFTRNIGGREITVSLSAMPTTCGPRLVIHMPRQTADLLQLVGDDSVRTRLGDLLGGDGLIVVAGRRRTGRDEVLRALLAATDTDGCSVLTIEKDPACEDSRIACVRVDPGCGLTWSIAAAAMEAQDPDTILLTELRDPPTALRAFEAAHDGALVLAGINAASASAAIEELLAMGIEPWPLGTTLKAVIEQTSAQAPCRVVLVEDRLAEAIRKGGTIEQSEQGTCEAK